MHLLVVKGSVDLHFTARRASASRRHPVSIRQRPSVCVGKHCERWPLSSCRVSETPHGVLPTATVAWPRLPPLNNEVQRARGTATAGLGSRPGRLSRPGVNHLGPQTPCSLNFPTCGSPSQ